MKTLIALFLTISVVLANDLDIDWSKVRPVEEFPAFKAALEANLPKDVYNKVISPRIVNGHIAREFPRQFPFQIAVIARFRPGDGLCGGSVLTKKTVMTAAHCIDLDHKSTSAEIIAGAHNITKKEPQQFRARVSSDNYLIHDEWDLRLIANDIALIRMPSEHAFIFNEYVQPVHLPSDFLHDNFQGQAATVAGWGIVSDESQAISDVLRFVTGPVMSNRNCNFRFPTIIRPSHICLDGSSRSGPCSGDSGGPLIVHRGGNDIQIGIVSFGLALGCERTWPGVFVRVTSYYDWINQRMI